MAARYRVLISDALLHEMLSSAVQWPQGIRLDSPVTPPGDGPDIYHIGRSHWCWVTDENAPPELDGRNVALSVSQLSGGGHHIERRLAR